MRGGPQSAGGDLSLAAQLLFSEGDQARLTYFLLAEEWVLRTADSVETALAGSLARCRFLSPTLPRLQRCGLGSIAFI